MLLRRENGGGALTLRCLEIHDLGTHRLSHSFLCRLVVPLRFVVFRLIASEDECFMITSSRHWTLKATGARALVAPYSGSKTAQSDVYCSLHSTWVLRHRASPQSTRSADYCTGAPALDVDSLA